MIQVLAAALAAVAVAWWSYGTLEEPVAGRRAPAALRAGALFFLLAGWWLPPLPFGTGGSETVRALLLDASASMSLPARLDGPSRADSAARLAEPESADVWLAFGDSARPSTLPEYSTLPPADLASRLVPALEAARAAGADSAIVVTDGELDDREAARAAIRRLGLPVREIRAAEPIGRLAIRQIDAPRAVEAGDTIRFVVEVAAVGQPLRSDSASISLDAPDGTRTIVRFVPPTPGRTRRVRVSAVAGGGSGDAWRAYDVRLQADADPLAPGLNRRVWIEVVATAAGAVVVAVDPDWEPHYLLPVLDRSTEGGARAWLRVGADRWIRSGSDRLASGDGARVRSDAARARLLVVQGTPGEGPAWLQRLAERHPRVLWLARGPGRVPGSSMRVGAARPGEWYPGGPPPSSPIAGYLEGVDDPSLPPVGRLFVLEGQDWAPLELRRNRTGAGEPPIGGERTGDRRRIVVAAEGLWRWASRAGETRELYRSMFAGLAGWHLEAADRRPLELVSTRLSAGDTIRWRAAPEVDEVRLTVRDSTGSPIWSDTLATPDTLITGPPAPEGTLRFEAEGRLGPEGFRVGRPFEAEGTVRELAAREAGDPLDDALAASGLSAVRAGRAVWPFVLAALMLCGEWLWRRRIGLR